MDFFGISAGTHGGNIIALRYLLCFAAIARYIYQLPFNNVMFYMLLNLKF